MDIEELKDALEKLRIREKHYRILMDESSDLHFEKYQQTQTRRSCFEKRA